MNPIHLRPQLNRIAIVALMMTVPAMSNTFDAFDAFAQGNSPRTLPEDVSFLSELVDIGSDTPQVEYVAKCQDKVALRLEKLGFKTRRVSQPSNEVRSAPLLIAEKRGVNPRFITLLMHADTVFGPDSGFAGFKRNGDQAIGPGVIDAKGGIVVALRALELFLTSTAVHRHSLRVVVSPSEEVGSTGFTSLYSELAADTDVLLGFEPALANGSIVTSRRGDRWYDIRIEGAEAHAGRDHKKGANACHELAIKLGKLHQLTDYRKDVSINVGHIEGGKNKYAIVCGNAHAKLDVRFSDEVNRAKILKKVEAILSTTFVRSHDGKSATRTTYKVVDDPHPFPFNKKAAPFVALLLQKIQLYEKRRVAHERSGGTADSNFFYRPGIVIIDGLGPVGGNMHRNDEFIDLATIGTRAQAVADLLAALHAER